MPPWPRLWHEPLAALGWLLHGAASLVGLLALLSIAAATPGANLLALGYLLHAQAEVVRADRRIGPAMLPLAGRLSAIALGLAIWLMPIWLLANAAHDARLIDPAGVAARRLGIALPIAAALTALHLLLAFARGASFDAFFRPLKNVRFVIAAVRRGEWLRECDESVRRFLRELQPLKLAALGAGGLAGSAAWLVIPAMLLSLPYLSPGRPAYWSGIAGGSLLSVVLAWLPSLQVRFAVERRWRAMFDVRGVRDLIRRAPLAYLFTTLITYAASLPLFFWSAHVKMELPFHRGILDLTILSVTLGLPARLATAWAYRRATRRQSANRYLTMAVRLLIWCVLCAYTFLLHISVATAEFGRHWLNQFHALLLPLPW